MPTIDPLCLLISAPPPMVGRGVLIIFCGFLLFLVTTPPPSPGWGSTKCHGQRGERHRCAEDGAERAENYGAGISEGEAGCCHEHGSVKQQRLGSVTLASASRLCTPADLVVDARPQRSHWG